VFAGWVAPHNPFDLTTLELSDARLPPAWSEAGSRKYLLGTDDQGRDILSAVIYGARISLVVGCRCRSSCRCWWAWRWGCCGLSWRLDRRRADAPVRRDAVFPAILVALLIAGVGRALFPNAGDGSLAFGVLIFSISLTGWVQYARTVRGSTLVERNKEYVQAARVTGRALRCASCAPCAAQRDGPGAGAGHHPGRDGHHHRGDAVFLGVGAPPTSPSLGTLIRVGNDYLFSGEWWITVFPGRSCWC
jgi:peptide/nickel transport system permease protein